MSGIFPHRRGNLLFGSIVALTGVVISIKFGVWGLQSITSGDSFINLFVCLIVSLIGFLAVCFSIYLIKFNKGAYLNITDTIIEAKYGWDTKLSLDISEISDISMNGIQLTLKTINNKVYTIPGLLNAKELSYFLKQLLNIKDTHTEDELDLKKAAKTLHSVTQKFKLHISVTIFFMLMMFVNILITVLLTDSAEISDFNSTQSAIFISFIIVEIITVILCFVFANKAGKYNNKRMETIHKIAVEKAKKNKDHISEQYGTVFEINYFNEYLNRVVIFQPKEMESYSFMLEVFDWKEEFWKPCYDKVSMYETFEDVKDATEELFADEFFEEQYQNPIKADVPEDKNTRV